MSSLLAVIVGIVFTFLVFSVVCSGLYELGAKALALRSRELWRTLRQLLDGVQATVTTVERPLVVAATGTTSETGATSASTGALADQLYRHPLVRPLDTSVKATKSRLHHITTPAFSRALLGILDTNGQGSTPIDRLREAVSRLDDTPVRSALNSILNEAGDDLERVRHDVEDWFDTNMAALSRTYRRRARYITAVIGLIVAVVANVSMIEVTTRLYHDEALREAVAAQAVAVESECQTTSDGRGIDACTKSRLGDIRSAIQLPLGWTGSNDDVSFLRILGWLIGGIGFGLGASFWFDVLKRTSGLRR
jgi:hypothetical protein